MFILDFIFIIGVFKMVRVLSLFVCICLASNYSFSQFEFLKKKVEEKIEKKVEEVLEEENENPKKQKTKEEQIEKKSEPVKADLKSYSKYDFIPGDKTLFLKIFRKMQLEIFLNYGQLTALEKYLQLINIQVNGYMPPLQILFIA